jgi:hypothetical protein
VTTKLESQYKAGLVKRIAARLSGCIFIENDPQRIQGIPDLLILFGPHWAMLEIKAAPDSERQPNQVWYVDTLNDQGGFAAVIYPENEEEVLSALQQAFGARGKTCLS